MEGCDIIRLRARPDVGTYITHPLVEVPAGKLIQGLAGGWSWTP